MAESRTAVANLAISNIANADEIANLEDPAEKSAEARAVRRVWDTCLGAVLRDFDWGFARTRLVLGVVGEKPTPTWGLAYGYPTDCAFLRALEGETEANPLPFEIWRHAGKKAVFTNVTGAVAIYTAIVEDTAEFPPDFELALAWKISVAIAPRLTKAEDKVAVWALRQYNQALSQAAANAMNEQRKSVSTSSSFSRARGWGR